MGRPPPFDPNCLRIRSVEKYLGGLQKHVGPALKLPPDFNEDGYVEVSFALDRDGAVSSRCIVRSSDTRLARSVIDALDTVSPFPPIPHEARCLAGGEIRRRIHTVER